MKALFVVSFLALIWTSPAAALTHDSGIFTELEFVTETQIPGPAESNMSLCYEVRALKVLGFSITRDVQKYVLTSDRCVGNDQRDFTTDQMVTAQSLNLIDASIPVVAKNDLRRNVQTYGLWGGISLALIAVIWRRIKSLLGYDLRGPMRKRASQNILSAMCSMAKCDGLVSSQQIELIHRLIKQLTRRDFAKADITRLADRVDANLGTLEFIALGKGLRDREKDAMMQGVLSVAIADGRMLRSEHAFATELAHGLGMPAEDFRRVLNIAMAKMEKMGS